MKYLLSIALLALLVLENVGMAQSSQMRGESTDATASLDLNETSRSIQCALLVEEIEEAGYAIDVEEGFDEEWEEEIWIATDEEEIEALIVDIEEAEDISEGEWEEVVWEEEQEENEFETFEEEELFAFEGEYFEEESDEEEFEDFMEAEWFDETEAAFNDFDEGSDWEEVLEEWEVEEYEFEEDIDLMEAIYNAG